MSVIPLKRKHTRKPSYPAQLKAEYRDAVFGCVYDGSLREITGKTPSGTVEEGSVTYPIVNGMRGVNLSSSGDNWIEFGSDAENLRFSNTSSFTILSVFMPTTTGSYTAVLAKDLGIGTRPLLQWRKTNTEKMNILFGTTGATLHSSSTTTSLSTTKVNVCACTRNVASDSVIISMDGKTESNVADASTGTWTITGTNSDLATAVRPIASFNNSNFIGVKYFDLILPRALSESELNELTANPWQAFEDRTQYIPISTGAAFKPYWARNATITQSLQGMS